MNDDSKSEAYDWHMVNQEWSKQQATINAQAARIAELEQALRELKKENELLRADCVSFAKFLNSGQLISQYIDKLIAKYIGE